VQVDLDRKIATVVYETDKASPAALTEATTAAGFPSSARDRSRNSVIVMMHTTGRVRGGARVIHRSAWGGANGRIVKDICPPASRGNGKGPP